MTPLQYAVHSGHLTSARELIRLGANVNAINPDGEGLAGYTPLRMAVFNYMKAKWFGKGANKNSDCSAKDLKSLILLMLKHGGDPDIRTPGSVTSPLLMTTEHGATDVVRWLLQAGADPNRAVGKGKRAVTPIEEAVYSPHSNAEVVKLLLYAGADPTVGLHTKGLLAKARKNMPKAVPLLKQYGAE
jgi:ankyrin repeat protein